MSKFLPGVTLTACVTVRPAARCDPHCLCDRHAWGYVEVYKNIS